MALHNFLPIVILSKFYLYVIYPQPCSTMPLHLGCVILCFILFLLPSIWPATVKFSNPFLLIMRHRNVNSLSNNMFKCVCFFVSIFAETSLLLKSSIHHIASVLLYNHVYITTCLFISMRGLFNIHYDVERLILFTLFLVSNLIFVFLTNLLRFLEVIFPVLNARSYFRVALSVFC